jgi:hypothetical protein
MVTTMLEDSNRAATARNACPFFFHSKSPQRRPTQPTTTRSSYYHSKLCTMTWLCSRLQLLQAIERYWNTFGRTAWSIGDMPWDGDERAVPQQPLRPPLMQQVYQSIKRDNPEQNGATIGLGGILDRTWDTGANVWLPTDLQVSPWDFLSCHRVSVTRLWRVCRFSMVCTRRLCHWWVMPHLADHGS